jgi:hypothetical protein
VGSAGGLVGCHPLLHIRIFILIVLVLHLHRIPQFHPAMSHDGWCIEFFAASALKIKKPTPEDDEEDKD